MNADLLGKLRALKERASGPESWIKTQARDDIADLLPQIIAQLEQLTTERDEAQRYYIDCVQRYTRIGG